MPERPPCLDQIGDILDQFDLPASDMTISPLGSGHINTTLKLRLGDQSFVVQKINSRVFPEPCRVAENTQRVSTHLRRAARQLGQPPLVPEILCGREGRPWALDESGECWRLQRYVAQARVLPHIESAHQAWAAGEAFGRFQKLLLDFPSQELRPAIPHFHELNGYLEDLDQALGNNHSAEQVGPELTIIDQRRKQFDHAAPLRWLVIHGDCKLNNLLFSERLPDALHESPHAGAGEACQSEVITVIDLDTVMLGDTAWDFGDLVRSAAARGKEDSALGGEQMEFSLEIFEPLARGFLHQACAWIDSDRRVELVHACRRMTYMLAIRFLTDYLQGDVYFNIDYPGQNLMRARSQLHLLMAMERSETAMVTLLKSI